MNRCPFCGDSLTDAASFCPHCAASLIEKTEIKPYRTLPLRPLLFLLIPVSLLGAIFLLLPQKQDTPTPLPDSSESFSVITDTEAATDSEEIDLSTDLPALDSDPSSEATDGISSEHASDVTDSQIPSDMASLPLPDMDTEEPSDAATQTTTDTDAEEEQIEHTPETAPLSGTYFYKGVEWCYKTPTNKGGYPVAFYPYPLEEIAIITGVNSVSIDGVYYVPETIYGKHVAILSFDEDSEARYPFSSSQFKKAVRVIYFPPGVTAISSLVLKGCNALTDLYIGGEFFFLNGFPDMGEVTIHTTKTCVNTVNYNPFQGQCHTYSTDTLTCTWEEWDPSTLYPEEEQP